MPMSARNAAPMIIAATAAVAWGIVTAAPAVAEPGDSGATSPTVGDSTVLPLPISTIDRIWNQFVPPNAIVPQSPIATFGPYVEQIFPLFRSPPITATR
jgi:hypothetical protein